MLYAANQKQLEANLKDDRKMRREEENQQLRDLFAKLLEKAAPQLVSPSDFRRYSVKLLGRYRAVIPSIYHDETHKAIDAHVITDQSTIRLVFI